MQNEDLNALQITGTMNHTLSDTMSINITISEIQHQHYNFRNPTSTLQFQKSNINITISEIQHQHYNFRNPTSTLQFQKSNQITAKNKTRISKTILAIQIDCNLK